MRSRPSSGESRIPGEILGTQVETPAVRKPPAWELVEAGRYMPRRIRGSFHGRELG